MTTTDTEADPDLDSACEKYQGAFVESADLMHLANGVTLEIEKVTPPDKEKDKDGKGKLINKPILTFRGARKRFIVGKTNERILKAIHGKKASGWKGKKITLGVRYLEKAFGELNVPTIRIIPPENIPLPMSTRDHFGRPEPWPKS